MPPKKKLTKPVPSEAMPEGRGISLFDLESKLSKLLVRVENLELDYKRLREQAVEQDSKIESVEEAIPDTSSAESEIENLKEKFHDAQQYLGEVRDFFDSAAEKLRGVADDVEAAGVRFDRIVDIS